MAKVSLRIYNREIENFIEEGRTDEAIAHCRHILGTFSKHLATYRLLGKAYLESKHYNEAVDIFGRVLMSVPDDFVSHVGMSIIRDEENKLDDAIWHMQRAFESQPSNSAIQGELQRLYGRRDGMEPPKIRMTRGALAQMYVQGELYPQAIAEIRAVLSPEPDRADMQVLLARAYFRGGQKADASDICAQLLKRYPYCFDANRIMVDLLPATVGAVENTQVYRMRVGELDPYATFAKGSAFLSDEVADAAINLERLEYKEEARQTAQDWGPSLGLKSGDSSAPLLASTTVSDQPDWLKSGGFSDSQLGSLASSQNAHVPESPGASQPGDAIPDFLRDAGWGDSSSPEQPTSFFDSEPAGGDLTPAEIPDWLKGQVPSQPDEAQSGAEQSIKTPDWLSGLGDSQTTESDITLKSTGPGSLAGFGDSQDAKTKSSQAADVPDWLAGLGDSQTSEPAQAGGAPDWLSGLGDSQTSEPPQAADVPDWLAGLAGTQAEPAQQATIPDWMAGSDSQNESARAPIESLGASAAEQDDAVAWLESLAAKHGGKPEEMVTDPNKRSETPPDWVSQAQNIEQQAPAPQATAPSVESLGSTAQEQDDAVAWLESLAAKHGGKPEEMVTDPNKRSETPPGWVSQAQNIDQQAPAPQAAAPSVESLGSTAQEQDDAVAWLESLAAKHGGKPEEMVTDPNKRFDNPPEWVSQAQSIGEAQSSPTLPNAEAEQSPVSERVEKALNIGEKLFAEFENASSAAPASVPSPANDETGMWLRNLEETEKQDEFSAQPGDTKGLPDWLSDSQSQAEQVEGQSLPRSDIPDWLNDPQQTPDTGSQLDSMEQESAAEKSEVPDWLAGEEDSAAKDTFGNQVVSQNDLSNWLSGLDDEPGLPFDELPTPDSILISSMPAVPAKKPPAQEPVASTSDLPDWLSDVDSRAGEPEDEWRKPIAQEPVVPDSRRTEETFEPTPAPVNQTDNLPDWLQRTDQEESAKEVQQPKPTSPSDWHPVEPKQPMSVPLEKKETPKMERRKPVEPPPPAEPFAQRAPAEPPVEARTPSKKKSGLQAKQRQPEAQSVTVALNQAKGELDRGDIPAALEHYKKLIKKGRHLEETIRDLTESIYRYPVEVAIWQTLGDAYMRSNRLKEALESYNKAEELIR